MAGCNGTTIPNGVVAIANYALQSHSGLTSVTFPDSLITVGESAFYGTGITALDTNNVTTIGQSAFYDCSDLEILSLGANTQTLNSSFGNCTSLVTVACWATTPPSINVGEFDDADANCQYYVPYDSISAYQSAFGWSNYTVQAIPETEPIVGPGTVQDS